LGGEKGGGGIGERTAKKPWKIFRTREKQLTVSKHTKGDTKPGKNTVEAGQKNTRYLGRR